MRKYPLIFCLLLIQQIAFAQKSLDVPYQFPVRPGTESWAKFKNGQEMRDACQIPSEALTKLTTRALILTFLDYPRLINLYAYNDLQTGIDRLKYEFNGLGELMVRPNAGLEMLEIYREANPDETSKFAVLEDQGSLAFKITVIELLLSQRNVIKSLSVKDKKELVSESLKKFKQKEVLLDIFGGQGLITSALIMGRVLADQKLLKPVAKGSTEEISQSAFLNRAEVLDGDIVLEVIREAQNFLK